MKKYFSIILFFAVVLMTVISCKKDNKYIAVYKPVSGDAFLRVVHVSPNFRAIQNYPDSFNIYVGKNKINGSLFTYNSFFPASTANTNTYFAIPSGAQQIRLSLQGVITIDSLTIISLQKDITPGYFYTFFITDSLQTQQLNTKVWVQDDFPIPDTGKYAVRFAHMVLNDTAGKKVEVYSTRQAATIFTNISPGTVTSFITLPVLSGDTIIVRRPGTLFELDRFPRNATGQPSPVSYTNNQRVYTILYKGNAVSTAGTKGRSILVYNNR